MSEARVGAQKGAGVLNCIIFTPSAAVILGTLLTAVLSLLFFKVDYRRQKAERGGAAMPDGRDSALEDTESS
jgi:hypothetical protein